MPFFYLLVVVGAAAIAVFALQNAEQVTIRFLAWKVERAPLAAVILISGAAGGFLMTLVGFVRRVKLRAKMRQLEARLRTGGAGKSGG
jgi:uncharacterized integral membrane protein